MSQKIERTDHLAPTVSVELAARRTVDQPAALNVHIRNVSDTDQDMIAQIRGLEPSWTPAPAMLPKIPAGATVSVELPITPPPGTPAGSYPFIVDVEARTQVDNEVHTAHTLSSAQWLIDSLSDLVLSVEPADARGLMSRKVKIQVANSGSQPRAIALDTVSDNGLSVSLSDKNVDIPAGQSAQVKAKLRARKVHLFHSSPRRSYTVIATGQNAPARFSGTFQSRALLPSTVLRVIALLLVVAMWAGGTVTALPWLSDRFNADRTQQIEVSQDDETPDGSSSQGDNTSQDDPRGGDAGATSPEGDSSSADDTESSDEDKVRIAGAITGASRDGVTVSISPASSLAAETAQFESATTASAVGTVADVSTAVLANSPGGAVWQLVSRSVLSSELVAATESTDATRSKSAGKSWREALPVERNDSTPQSRSTVTESDGTWAFGGMDPTARYLVTLSKPGFQTVRYFVTGDQAAQVPLEVELAAGQGSLSGRVTGPKGPVGGVEITLTDGTTTLSTRTATSGDIGSWSVSGLSTPSNYLVTAVGEGLSVASKLVSLDAASNRNVDFTLKRGVATLRGTVSGPNSRGVFAPLGAVSVVAEGEGVIRSATTATADSNTGTFILPDLPVPGKYTVTVSADGYLTQIRQVTLTTRKAAHAIDMQIQRAGGTVVGTVKDESGGGLAGAGMILSNDDNTYKTMSASDGAGGFRFDGVAAGTYVLSGQIFGHETAFAQVKVTNGRSRSVGLVLTSIDGNGLTATSRIRGRAVDATTGASITCPNLRADEVCAVTVTTQSVDRDGVVSTLTATQLPDAQYTLPGSGGLYPGRYRLTFTAPGYEPATVDVEVAMDSVVEAATAALYPSPSISGNILTRVGSLPSGTCVVATLGTGPAPTGYPCATSSDGGCQVTGRDDSYCAFADAAVMGSYTINRLPSGTYQVRTFVPDDTEYVSDETGVTLALQGGDAKRYDATLDRLGRILLTVLRSTGNGSLVAGKNAYVEIVSTGSVSYSGNGVASETGYLVLSKLPDSVYSITAHDAGNAALTGMSEQISIGLNQELSVQVVITSGVPTVQSRVVSQLEAATFDPVKTATVTVTGVVRYTGVIATRETVVIPQTSDDGEFTICTDQPCSDDPHVAYLPLIEENVDIEVSAPNYVTYTRNNVPVSELTTITIEPSGVPFAGSLTLLGADTADIPSLSKATAFTVISAPPGTGSLSLSADEDGHIIWSDSLQPINPDGGRMIRPGRYVVRAALNGFDPQELQFDVAVGQTLVEPAFTLSKYGELRVFAMARTSDDSLVQVEAPTMEIRLLDGTTRTVTASGSRTYVDFGSLPSGSYDITAWLAGFDETVGTITVLPGQTTSSSPTPATQIVLTPLNVVTGTVYSQYEANWLSALSGARVSATLEGSSGDPFTAVSDENGTFQITGTKDRVGLVDGRWQFTASASNHTHTQSGTLLPSTRTTDLASPGYVTKTTLEDLGLTPTPGKLNVTVTNPETNQAITQDITLTLAYNDGLHSIPSQTGSRCAPEDPNDPSFCFTNLLPLTYTLTVTGSGYAPVTTAVSISPGVTHIVRLPMTNPGGSVQGTVSMQVGSQVSAVDGAQVELVSTADPDNALTATTNASGNFLFDSVSAGNYTLTASYNPNPGGTSSALTVQRTVVVGIAQSLFVDLLLIQPSASITVEAESGQGFDLTGALVSLFGDATMSPQPLTRSTTDPDRYVTTFVQVPYGSFQARLSGPTGHLGEHTSSTVTVDANTPNETVTMTVNETRVQLVGASEAAVANPPSIITAHIGNLAEVSVPVNDNVIVYVPHGTSRAITATAGSWLVKIPSSQQTVGTNALTHSATLTVARHSVNVQLDQGDPQSVPVGGAVTWSYTVSSTTTNSFSGGSVSLERLDGNTWTTVVSSVPVAANGQGSLSYTAQMPVGSAQFRLQFAGTEYYEDATSNTRALTVTTIATSIQITSSQPGVVTAVLLPANAANDIGPSASQFAIGTGSGNNWTALTTNCSRSANTLTCTGVTEGASVQARFTAGQNSQWASSQSSSVNVMATPPAPGGGS